MSNHTTLHINCQPDDKAAWMLTARTHGMPFEDWVRQQLNAAKIDPNPTWAAGLSERTRVCLITAGFNSRPDVEQAIAEGFDIASISNAGQRVKNEVTEWLSK